MAEALTALDSLVRLFACSFAAWRIARMIAGEDGPFDVFTLLRARIDAQQKTWIGRGLNCVICVSFWTALLFVLVLPPFGYTLSGVSVAWFAAAGIAVFINLRSIR